MVYGILLAGGSGTRIGAAVPKQFVEVGGKPILYYTVRNMLAVSRLTELYISVHQQWLDYTNAMVQDHFAGETDRIRIVLGGKERQDSIDTAVAAICEKNSIGSDDILLIHEAARPFATTELMDSTIDGALVHGAAVCAQPACDTIFVSEEGSVIDAIPARRTIFQGQTPDSYCFRKFLELEAKLTPAQREALTGDPQVWTMNGEPIHIVSSGPENFKITTLRDLQIATYLLQKEN